MMKKLLSLVLAVALIVTAMNTYSVSAAGKKKQSPKITKTNVSVNEGYKKEIIPLTVENAYGKVSFSFAKFIY